MGETPLLQQAPLTATSTATPTAVRTTRFAAVALVCFVLLPFIVKSPPTKLDYHSLFLSLADNSTAARHLHTLTSRPHVAGTPANEATADYVLQVLSSASFPAHKVFYDVLLTYPIHRSLALSPSPPPSADWTKVFALVQEVYPGDPYAAEAAEVMPTFHAYAHSGTAAGSVVYANYGRVEDFTALKAMGVNVTGVVVLAKYGEIFRGDIVRNAQDAGAAAALLYTDPKDYDGGSLGWFPHGPGMPPSGVQMGSTFLATGDPLTPGWPSAGDCERLSVAEVAESGVVPGIPSLPISSEDGEAIQRTIGGLVAPEAWQGGQGAPVYRIGPGPGFINLTYIGNDTIATIQNVFAVIEGELEPDRYVLLGNHRDAWTFGGADPSSGTAALLELAGRLATLQKRGWKPRRTIILCNWDAEEYGLIGSTEWVEENMGILASRAVAYLNVDIATEGPVFHASATPQLDSLIKQASKMVLDPDNSSQTLYDSWMTHGSSLVGRLGGGGSDYASFVQHVGVPSVDMSFGKGYAVYHSLYDDFVWMQKFGDPAFLRHVAVASIWGLVALRLADEEILPFDYLSYASELEVSTITLEHEVSGMPVNVAPLHNSVKEFKRAASNADDEKKDLQEQGLALGWTESLLKARELNDRLMMTERAFTDPDGLPGDPWYKHLIYGRSKHNDYGSNTFPGIISVLDEAKGLKTSESWRSVQHEVWRVARVIRQASLVLSGNLT